MQIRLDETSKWLRISAFANISCEYTNPSEAGEGTFSFYLLDSYTDLQNNLNRWYDPHLCRWMSVTNATQVIESPVTVNWRELQVSMQHQLLHTIC